MTTAIDVVLLDSGNTLAGWNLDLVISLLADAGVHVTSHQLERAEAASRPMLSDSIAAGHSTESVGMRRRYLHLVLEHLSAADSLDEMTASMSQLPTGVLWSRLLPGVPEALASMTERGLRLGVVSNSDGTIERQLEDHGIGHRFDVVMDSGIAGVEKPDPAIFLRALEALGCAPDRAIHVGDLYAVDVVGARAAGIRPVLVDPFGDWRGLDCDTVSSVAELGRLLT